MRNQALACLGVALFAAVLVVVWGPGDAANPDSATYIDGARHLARGDGYVSCRTPIHSHRPDPIRAWPPGFSALMVPGIWLGLSPLTSARVVLGVSFVAAAVLVYLLARRVSGPRAAFLPFLAVGLFAFQPSQLYVVNRVLSDVPFVPLALGCVLLALRLASARQPSLASKLGLGVALVAMVLVRNAGLLMAAGILAGLLVSMRGSSLAERARALLPVVATSGALFAPWMLRNKLVGDTPLGRVGIHLTNPFPHAASALRGTAHWLSDAFGSFGSFRAVAWLYVAGVVAVGLAVIAAAVRYDAWRARPVRLLGSAFLVYLALMVATATLHPFNGLQEERFWVASWPLGLLVVLFAVRHARLRLPWAHRAAVGGLALTGALYFVSFARALPRADRAGGFLRKDFKAMAGYLPSKKRCRLLVNDARPALLHRELGPTSPLPKTRAAFEAALNQNPRLCLAVAGTHEWNAENAPALRPRKKSFRGVPLVRALAKEGRLRLLVDQPSLRVFEAVPPRAAGWDRLVQTGTGRALQILPSEANDYRAVTRVPSTATTQRFIP